jgi:hypothetical protein
MDRAQVKAKVKVKAINPLPRAAWFMAVKTRTSIRTSTARPRDSKEDIMALPVPGMVNSLATVLQVADLVMAAGMATSSNRMSSTSATDEAGEREGVSALG